MARTQRGNNNAYCQDNEISWFAWPPTGTAARLLDFTRRLIRLRLDHPVFQRRRFFQGRRIHGSAVKDLSWLRPDGSEMTDEEWGNWHSRCLGLQLAGDAIEEVDDDGLPVRDETFLLRLNAQTGRAFRAAETRPHLEGACLETRIGNRFRERLSREVSPTRRRRTSPGSAGARNPLMATCRVRIEEHRTAVAQLDMVAARLHLEMNAPALRYPRRAPWSHSVGWTAAGRKSSWRRANTIRTRAHQGGRATRRGRWAR